VLYSPEVLDKRVQGLAKEISDAYHVEGVKDIVCVGLLNGAVCFMVDLCKHLNVEYSAFCLVAVLLAQNCNFVWYRVAIS
jgi:hypoxanthine-guanine phosphoribosyltransferase